MEKQKAEKQKSKEAGKQKSKKHGKTTTIAIRFLAKLATRSDSTLLIFAPTFATRSGATLFSQLFHNQT